MLKYLDFLLQHKLVAVEEGTGMCPGGCGNVDFERCAGCHRYVGAAAEEGRLIITCHIVGK